MTGNRRVRLKKRTADTPIYWFLTGALICLLTLPFIFRFVVGIYWKTPWSGVIVTSVAAKKDNDSIYTIQRAGKLNFQVKGILNVGSFVGFVGPHGTLTGFIGMPMNGSYNVPGLDTFRHAALLYRTRIGNGPWSGYGYATTAPPFWVSKGQKIQFVVNDKEWQNNIGHYKVRLEFCDTCRQ
jgi:hypothetical protein